MCFGIGFLVRPDRPKLPDSPDQGGAFEQTGFKIEQRVCGHDLIYAGRGPLDQRADFGARAPLQRRKEIDQPRQIAADARPPSKARRVRSRRFMCNRFDQEACFRQSGTA